MPIYEFVCESCGRLVERLQKVSDPPPAACPECGGKMAKIMSRNSFQLKGGGWYRDLYGSSNSSGGSGKTGSGSGESAKSSAATTSTASQSTGGSASSAAAAPAKKAD